MSEKLKTYNHMFDIAFSVSSSPHEDIADVPADVLLEAMRKRVDDLANDNPSEIHEAVGFCDTYEED